MKTKFFSKFVLVTAVVLCAGALTVGDADAKKKWGKASASNTSVAVGLGLGIKHVGGGGIGIAYSSSQARGEATGATSTDSEAGGDARIGGGASHYSAGGSVSASSYSSASVN
jgi:hypothetical protein